MGGGEAWGGGGAWGEGSKPCISSLQISVHISIPIPSHYHLLCTLTHGLVPILLTLSLIHAQNARSGSHALLVNDGRSVPRAFSHAPFIRTAALMNGTFHRPLVEGAKGLKGQCQLEEGLTGVTAGRSLYSPGSGNRSHWLPHPPRS